MSEDFSELASQFLRITRELTRYEPTNIVTIDQVAAKLPDASDPISPEYRELLTSVAMDLGRQDFLQKISADWVMFSITKEGIDEVEGRNRSAAAGPTVNIYGSVHGSVVGTHNTAELTNTFNFGEFEEAIEERGGHDKAELLELREQVQTLLEERDTVSRGVWAKFSELLKKHPWAVEFIGRAAAGWLTQQTGL